MRSIIITAADELFAGHLRRLLQSLHQWDTPLCDAIGVLDLGLADTTINEVRECVDHFVVPGWDLPCDPSLRKSKPYLKAQTVRPFLPRYFPGYDLYLWLDADTWVQERFAVEQFFRAAQQGALGIVAQKHPSYVHTANVVAWRRRRLEKYFGPNAPTLLDSHPYYNAGAFSLRADAPHWDSWAQHFRRGLENCPIFVCDQTALNYAIWKDQLPVHSLPALCNWCCHLAMPGLDSITGKLCEPQAPHQPIGLIHMTAGSKGAAPDKRSRSQPCLATP